ncbi:NAD(P)H-quinone oxidoreductase [Cesiribacter andamanensis]|uniref:Mycocerosic acid synthase n=1 Tax=Cesiribacter andamanensis AMV16 TaxID=1279009 RepID=M7N532_9BACT|nr:NAD(P)H-quinone oxidoreductase [Cesiribacter andamanensis]EMR02407.1 Mycocerosic acid synthase [Cesiribacter andamanensis AMV16]
MATSMQALLVKDGQLHTGQWPTPRPGPGELLVAVKAAGINRADLLQRQGHYPPPEGASPLLGLEVAGLVQQLGEGVTDWKVGDRVFGLLPGGGYAHYALLHSQLAMRIPEELDFSQAAALPEVFLTAWQALVWLARLQAGEQVLIHAGASGVGTAAIQLARALGATPWVTASAGKHPLCRELGAGLCIDYKTEDFAERVAQESGGRGVDVILDFIGAGYWQQNLQSLALDGRLVLLAFLGGTRTETNLAPLLRKRISVFGSTLRSRPLAYQAALTKDLAAFLLPRLKSGELQPVLHRVYPWQEAASAHQEMEQNATAGKLVLAFS